MNTEQEKLVIEILKELVAVCVREMGVGWCSQMMEKIDQIKFAGKV